MRVIAAYAWGSDAESCQRRLEGLDLQIRGREGQERPICRFADVVAQPRDPRPGVEQVLLAARRHELGLIVVLSLEQLGRDLQELVGLLHQLATMKLPLVVLAEDLDTRRAPDRRILDLAGILHTYQHGQRRRRALHGVVRAKLLGSRLGRPPAVARRLSNGDALAAVAACGSQRRAAELLGVSLWSLRRALSQQPGDKTC